LTPLRSHVLAFALGIFLLVAGESHGQFAGRIELTETGDFSEAAVVRGVKATQAQCLAVSHSVWADAGPVGAECLRVWATGMDPLPAKRALVYFHGDVFVGHGKTARTYLNSSVDEQARFAQNWARQLGVPYLFIGRPGVYGSSGDHMQRRRQDESLLISAAMDSLKQRHGIEEWVVAGQSGGGHVTAALLTQRNDIVCAVPTSAPSSPRIRWELMGRNRDTTGYTDSYEPSKFLVRAQMHPALRVFVLGNPEDRNVFWPSQVVLADALKTAGIPVEVIEAPGSGPDGHGLSNAARVVAAWCAKNLSTADILARAAKGLKP
jgi:pimeloyl-ACP methyl ester carboxylesterase